MKERIIKVLREHPCGLRKRDIAGYLGVWVCNLAKPMADLEIAGTVSRTYHADPANMEFYDIWYLTERT